MELKKTKARSKKRVGRGYGSGKGGHTAGRGQKGQKSRSGLHILFEGVKTRKSLLVRLPLLRGKSKFHAKPKPVTINLDELNVFKEGAVVSVNSIIRNEVVRARDAKRFGVKILGQGDLKIKKLDVQISATKSARETIEELGGMVQ